MIMVRVVLKMVSDFDDIEYGDGDDDVNDDNVVDDIKNYGDDSDEWWLMMVMAMMIVRVMRMMREIDSWFFNSLFEYTW